MNMSTKGMPMPIRAKDFAALLELHRPLNRSPERLINFSVWEEELRATNGILTNYDYFVSPSLFPESVWTFFERKID